MSQLSERSRQSRSCFLAERKPFKDFQAPPKVTHGKSDKLLPLRGTQFMRFDAYDVPADKPHSESPVQQRRISGAREPDPDDSPLSEDELEAVYGRSERNASPALPFPSSRTRCGRTNAAPFRKASVQSRRQGSEKTTRVSVHRTKGSATLQPPQRKGFLPKNAPRENGSPAKLPEAVVVATCRPAHTERLSRLVLPKPRRRIIQRDSVQQKVSERKTATPVRRIPVDELLIVPVPLEHPDFLRAAETSFASIQKQDPIVDSSSPALKALLRQAKCNRGQKETPLTSIGKRLKAPNFSHKSFVSLCKKEKSQRLVSIRTDRNLGDGFSSSELKSRVGRVKKQRTKGATLAHGLGPLQFQAGLLPEVKFENSNGILKLEDSGKELLVNHEGNQTRSTGRWNVPETGPRGRKVTFNDGFFDEATRAQLASVSAPKRVLEDSSDESEQEDDEEDEDDEEYDGDGERAGIIEDGKDDDRIDNNGVPGSCFSSALVKPSTPTSSRSANLSRSTESRVAPSIVPPDVNYTRKAGVTLDFRRSAPLGFASQRLRRGMQMEIDEMIIDENLVNAGAGSMSTKSQEHNYTLDHQGARRDTSSDHARRPRSILRPSTPNRHVQKWTRPEDTTANTRRNSNIAVESSHFSASQTVSEIRRGAAIGDSRQDAALDRSGDDPLDQSVCDEAATFRRKTAVMLEGEHVGYFGTASSQLQLSQEEMRPRGRPTISLAGAAASHVFGQRRPEAEIRVLDSSRAFPETSPQPRADYVIDFGLRTNTVRSKEDTTWTSSQDFPAAKPAMDLKSLTRSVSKEHGTLSQGGRRRPSLPFQSPVKSAKR